MNERGGIGRNIGDTGKKERRFTRDQICLPSAWRLSFLAKKFLGFLIFLAKILAIILGKVRKILQNFSRSWKEIQENFWISWQENQDYPRS